MTGRVHRIHVASERGGTPDPRQTVEAVAGAGLRGDRYFDDERTGVGRVGCDLTLIESETLDAFDRNCSGDLEPGAHRRNVTTVGVDLESLLGERFRVGEVVCLGVDPCDPCAYLERVTGVDGLQAALTDRGGLRCRIVESGRLSVGDRVERIRPPAETDA